MEIYIEYAFLENFLYDGGLLALAFFASKEKVRWGRIGVSATLGGVFALLFPFLRLPLFFKNVLKLTMGALLCMLAFPVIKTRKEWGRYALTTIFFFIFSFGFGGVLLALFSTFPAEGEGYTISKIPSVLVFFCFFLLLFACILGIRWLQARKNVYQNLVLCRLYSPTQWKDARGFVDSGNLATKNNRPVCFVAPDLLFSLFEEAIFAKQGTHVCDEMKIVTMAGERSIPLYSGEIELEGRKIQVYFASGRNMIGRGYDVLLHGQILEEKGEDL